MVMYLAYCVDKELWKAIDYPMEQVGGLQEQQEKDRRILLNDYQRVRLAAKAKRLTRRLLEKTTVKNILLANGYAPEPDLTRMTTWKEFVRSHWSVFAACDFFSIELLIKGKLVRYMMLFAVDLSTRRVEIVGVRSIKEECLNHLVLSSEEQLRHVLSGYLEHCYHERIHQGIDRIIEPRHEANDGEIICIERSGGLLRSYHRQAA